jgi:hypothetical protein
MRLPIKGQIDVDDAQMKKRSRRQAMFKWTINSDTVHRKAAEDTANEGIDRYKKQTVTYIGIDE